MWKQKNQGPNKGDGSRSGDSSNSTEITMDDKKDFMYDSGRTDSGFLSGGIVSETLSGEISPPPEPVDDSNSRDQRKTDQQSYTRLDSGVDVGLSDQLSELCIKEHLNDFGSASAVGAQQPVTTESSFKGENKEDSSAHPWELYFQQDEEGDTQLHIAVIKGSVDVVYSLIRMAPNPQFLDIRNDMRQTALHLAVLISAAKIVRMLVTAGARTDSVDHHGNTPLHLAVASGDVECVKELIQPLRSDVLHSLRLKYVPQRRPTIPPELNMFNYEGLACVHIAMMGGHMNILKLIVSFGADVDAREYKGGKTVLHMAVEKGDIGLVTTIVRDLQADPCPLTYAGESPYRLVKGSANQLEELLLNIGATSLGDSDSSDDEHMMSHDYPSEDEEELFQAGFHETRFGSRTITA